MKRLSELYNAKPFSERYDTLPGRIMLDTNVVQYLHDFGEFIFEGYIEDDNGFVSPRGRVIRPDSRLFAEIEALHRIFVRINNASFEFAVCGQTLVELADRSDPERRSALRWFYDLLGRLLLKPTGGRFRLLPLSGTGARGPTPTWLTMSKRRIETSCLRRSVSTAGLC